MATFKFRKLLVGLLLALIGAEAGMLLWQLPVFNTLELKSVDWRLSLREPDPSFGKDIVVILIDDEILAASPYRSPVPRDILATLVREAHTKGARVIGLDVFLKDLTWEEQDAALAEAIKASGNVFIVAAIRSEAGKRSLDLPHKKFLTASKGIGVADLPVDPLDQVVREAQDSFEVGGKTVETLSAVLYHEATKTDRLPDGFQRYFINYQSPPSTANPKHRAIRVLPASTVATGMLPKSWFENQIVLMGAGYSDNTDSYATPFYQSLFDYALTPGVEIHANALATLLQGRTYRFVGSTTTFLFIFLFAALVVLTGQRYNLRASSLAFVGSVVGYTVLAVLAFPKTQLVYPLVPFYIGLSIAFAETIMHRALTEGKQRKWIKGAFQRYLSPEFVDALVSDPDKLFLGGEEREISILFSDLEGFTSFSERLDAEQLVTFLNEYLDGMSEIVMKHGGTLDKFIGDAVMAFWNAPIEQPDHALRACRAALEMRAFSESMNQKHSNALGQRLRTRIGVNTGNVVVGNIGSQKRFDYTILGDQVNLASRLEGVNKRFDTSIVISDSTCDLVKDRLTVRSLEHVQVKGKEQAVQVYELLGQESPT